MAVRPRELPNITTQLASADALPDYRITCIFADKKARRKGATEARFVAPWI